MHVINKSIFPLIFGISHDQLLYPLLLPWVYNSVLLEFSQIYIQDFSSFKRVKDINLPYFDCANPTPESYFSLSTLLFQTHSQDIGKVVLVPLDHSHLQLYHQYITKKIYKFPELDCFVSKVWFSRLFLNHTVNITFEYLPNHALDCFKT